MARSRALPLLLVGVLALPACGARLDSDTRRAAAAGSLQQVDGQQTGGGGSAVSGAGGGPVAADVGGADSTGPVTGVAAGPADAKVTTKGGPAAAAGAAAPAG